MGNPASADPAAVRRTAAEAWIWGYPLLENYRTIYPQAIDEADPRYVGGFGVFRHCPQPSTPANTDVVTPNNDTPYSWAWLDLRAEPWVLEVPATERYHVLPVHDLDTVYAGFVGSRTTGDGAGRYLIAGPGHRSNPPDDFDGAVRADTNLVGILGRTYLAGPADVPALEQVQAGYRLKPLSEHLGQPRPVAAEPVWPVWRGEGVLDTLEFFSYLDFLLGFFPVLPADADLRGRLAELAVGGGDFEPAALPAEVREALLAGIADGRAELAAAVRDATTGSRLFGTREQLGTRYLDRARGAFKGLYGLPEEEAWYGGWISRQGGRQPMALTFPAGQLPPARFFWSVTMYRLPERLLVANEIDRYSIGDRTPGLVYADDGSLTLHLRYERPSDADEFANWLPAPEGPYVVAVRVYGPKPELLDGSWQLPDPTPR
ncbi:DUF1254 domain-containing protein [Streptomyces sp. TLI_171]|uniref:DUF1254 domain-containing protein n=1 Tax=Streptomyces sp. TLI_171 TaxID=1938859 RepID=UPI000C5AB4C6|nr:DUF1254 domain-containing protein [Streptomyces sp. TLI_171]RKE19775.1 hypothetical protein BX266_3103 [Streptomyces sp. TLI_171]